MSGGKPAGYWAYFESVSLHTDDLISLIPSGAKQKNIRKGNIPQHFTIHPGTFEQRFAGLFE